MSGVIASESTGARLLRSVSLDTLRGFECVARHLSFTAAAKELCLTQSAVSKQIRALEDIIGRTVFLRSARGISTTREGRALLDSLQPVLVKLGNILEQASEPSRPSISVSVTPSFASLWLMQKLPSFRLAEPDVDVRIDGSEALVTLEQEGFDVAVRLITPAAASASWRPIAQERTMLVASPEVACAIKTIDDLHQVPLLSFHDPESRFPWMAWSRWFERLQLVHRPQQPQYFFYQYEHLIKAAAEGVGVAIGRSPLILPQLRDGRLQAVLPEHVAKGMTYHLVVSERSAHCEEVKVFSDWIAREMANESLE